MEQKTRHPRAHFQREKFLLLDGVWDFAFDEGRILEKEGMSEGKGPWDRKIRVPFSYEYKDSLIGEKEHRDVIWYKKEVNLTKVTPSLLLGFNAVCYEADVWVNGHHVAHHIGSFSAFVTDIAPFAKVGNNVIVVRCYAPLDPSLPRGKQSWTGKPFSCWYTPNSGIWQSVFIDEAGEDYFDDYSITPDIDTNSFFGEIVTMKGLADKAIIRASHDGKLVKEEKVSLDGRHTRYRVCFMESNFVDEDTFWSPEHPYLYDLEFVLLADGKEVDKFHTHLGMRKISISKDGTILLNNKIVYQRLVLDQGYWQDSGLTAPSIDALRNDIYLAKEMGFNGARKHQKIENPYYYYFADELGFLTWCEMPSAYNFCREEATLLSSQWVEAVKLASKFSSVIVYVPFNESWGVRKIATDVSQQSLAKSTYYLTKALDNSRLVSTNDGWENLTESDVISIHDYSFDGVEFASRYAKEKVETAFQTFRPVFANGEKYHNQPLIMSEFGGISLKSSLDSGCWGYNNAAAGEEELLIRLDKLIAEIKKAPFQGYCYTQLTDVQQEVNGFLDANHQPKVDLSKLKKIFQK